MTNQIWGKNIYLRIGLVPIFCLAIWKTNIASQTFHNCFIGDILTRAGTYNITADENIIGAPKIYKYLLVFSHNTGLFSIASHLVIALPTLQQLKLSLIFCIGFVDWFMASSMYCSPYSYPSSNYCNSNCFRSFTLLKALAKSNINLFAIALKEPLLSPSRQLEEQ